MKLLRYFPRLNFDMIGSQFGYEPAEGPLETLADMQRERTKLRVQVENANLEFTTVVRVHKGAVVLAKPPGLKNDLLQEAFLRARPYTAQPDASDAAQELRLRVLKPHLNLKNGNGAIVCGVPREAYAAERRRERRFNARFMGGLSLYVDAHDTHYPIEDVSMHGCRVAIAYQHPRMLFPEGKPICSAEVRAGASTVPLAWVKPTVIGRESVSMAFEVAGDDGARDELNALLNHLAWLEQQALHRPQADA